MTSPRYHSQPHFLTSYSKTPLVTTQQMQSLDRRTIEEANIPSTTLMERAGTRVVEVLEQRFGLQSGKQVTVFCGKGNNGGDGLVIARLLHQKRARVHVILLTHLNKLTPDAQSMYHRFRQITDAPEVTNEPSEAMMRALSANSHMFIDALLGTGLSSPVKSDYLLAIDVMNTHSSPTIAVDVPSGIHSDTGAILGHAVKAHLTVTLGCPKIGLYLGSAIDHSGTIIPVDIGIPQSYVDNLHASTHLLTPEVIAPLLPSRTLSSHKGTFGHVGIVAGSPGKTGAAALAARATLRAGAGLVTVATPKSVHSTLETKLLEAMSVPMPETKEQTLSVSALNLLKDFSNDRDAIAVGPGLSTHSETGELIRQYLPYLEHGCVIDADGLNMLAGYLSVLSSMKTTPILTPHPGEMARLLDEKSPQSVNQNRLEIACNFAVTHHTIMVLKGARTIVAEPGGQSAICPTGNPGMATAGTGDVLTGVIASFLAQGLSPWDAARAGVYLHGLAGDFAAETHGEAGLIASDLIAHLPHAIQKTRSHCKEASNGC